jgi:hypothetical protein
MQFKWKEKRPYVDAWLSRTRKELSISDRLSEIAFLLETTSNESREIWEKRLRSVLDGTLEPSLKWLMDIDTLIAKPKQHITEEAPYFLL